jgi:hypothetical protein
MSKATGLTLAALAVLGAGTLHGLSIRNGLYDLIERHKTQKILPGSVDEPYNTRFTGIAPLDDLLSTLLLFFWPVVTQGGGAAGLSLLGIVFAGQSCASLTMILIEGMRKGNEGRLSSLYVNAPLFLCFSFPKVMTKP